MKPVMAAAIVLLAAASANGAVGDLTLKSCDPLGGGWSASLESGQAGRPASSYIRTVNSGAKVMTLYNRASGFSILVALDSARAGGQVLDVLRIDAPGDDASQVSAAVRWQTADGMGAASVDPVVVELEHGGRRVPAAVRGFIMKSAAGITAMRLMFGTCREGECEFDDAVHTVRFVDTNGNFRMDDPAKPIVAGGAVTGISAGDAILIDTAGHGQFMQVGSYGQPVMVDGAWHDLAISGGGTQVTATPTRGPFGKIKFDADSWTAALVSAEHVLKIQGGREPVSVPAGKYVVQAAVITRAGAEAGIVDNRIAGGKGAVFEVGAYQTTANPFGATPFTTRVAVQQQGKGREVVFQPAITESGGRAVASVSAGGAGGRAGVGEIQVYDGSRMVYSAALDFG